MKVSIVIPTYKRADYLDRLLKSISKQTFTEYEVIVVDDKSPNYDEYIPIIKKYEKKFKEFKFIKKNENKGAPNSRNIGIKESKYELIALVDDDDEWLPSKLEKQVNVFSNSNKNLGIVYTWADIIENGESIDQYKSEIEGKVKKEILQECFIPSPSIMLRKSCIVSSGYFDEKFPSCQDWDMWTRIILNGYEVKVVKDILTIYHKHNNGNIGLSKNAKKGYSMYYNKYKKDIFFIGNIKTKIHLLKFMLKKLLSNES